MENAVEVRVRVAVAVRKSSTVEDAQFVRVDHAVAEVQRTLVVFSVTTAVAGTVTIEVAQTPIVSVIVTWLVGGSAYVVANVVGTVTNGCGVIIVVFHSVVVV